MRRMIMSGLGLGPAGANVIMQLSRLAVGHGIAESTVYSGSLYLHPIKRTRTTLGYVMISLLGNDRERSVLRREVNQQHRSVHSEPSSAVAYDAFDPDLQLWVAACMYRGLEDSVDALYGPVDPATLDALYRLSSRFATTLQVHDAQWPSDRTSFDAYWAAALQLVVMDDVTRNYLVGIASLRFLPTPLRQILGPAHRFITAGFLAPRFRDELGLTWGPRHAALFEVFKSSLAITNRILPGPIREFPWNVTLRDAQKRIRSGRSFV
jgi:uncharacterized protein (DUF2236 family)